MFGRIKDKLKDIYYRKIKKLNVSEYNILLMRKSGISVGDNCRIYTNIISSEPSLIEIGNDVTISSNVSIITHDNAISKVIEHKTDIVGKIKIGNRCFIGMNSTIMYGVELGDRCVVGAGAVVVKSFDAGSVIAGNPARRICSIDEYGEKYKDKAMDLSLVSISEREKYFELNRDMLVQR